MGRLVDASKQAPKLPPKPPLLTVKPGDVWKHYKGGLYTIVTAAINEADQTHVVVYRSHLTGGVWVRPLEPVKQGFWGRLFKKPVSAWLDVVETPWGVRLSRFSFYAASGEMPHDAK